MEQEEKELASPLPVLPRLNRLDRLLRLLEEKQNPSSSCSIVTSYTELAAAKGPRCKTLSSALEEVHHKGTLIDRLETLERRVLQLSLEMDIGNLSRTSSSTIMAAEAVGRVQSPTGTGDREDQCSIIVARQADKGGCLTTQEQHTCSEAFVRISEWQDLQQDKRSVMSKTRNSKWLRCFRVEW